MSDRFHSGHSTGGSEGSLGPRRGGRIHGTSRFSTDLLHNYRDLDSKDLTGHSEDFVGLALFSNKVTIEEKTNMVEKLANWQGLLD